jgi:hypothetical protein
LTLGCPFSYDFVRAISTSFLLADAVVPGGNWIVIVVEEAATAFPVLTDAPATATAEETVISMAVLPKDSLFPFVIKHLLEWLGISCWVGLRESFRRGTVVPAKR